MENSISIESIKEDNLDFIRIAKQSKFTKDAPYLKRKWKNGTLVGLFKENNLLGFMWFNIAKRKNYLKLYYIAVDEKLRSKGYGNRMMQILFDEACRQRVNKITFLVSKDNPAIEFYKRYNPTIEEKEKDYVLTYQIGKTLWNTK